MKIIMYDMKNTMGEINNRLDTSREEINDLEYITIENI